MKSLNTEVSLMLDELLNNEAFQKALNIASQQIGFPIDQFDHLKAFLPEGSPWTMENVNIALQNYRANIIVETRKQLTGLSHHLKTRAKQEEAYRENHLKENPDEEQT